MTKRIFLFFTLLWCCTGIARAQGGIPFIRNFTATEYGAHNRNFDIACTKDNTVFVANFEGLLYYDHAEWRILHTPGITRITDLFIDSKGTVWTGGYNYIGKVETTQNGELKLRDMANRTPVKGEVRNIWEEDGQLLFLVGDSTIYAISPNGISLQWGKKAPNSTTFFGNGYTIVQQLTIGNELRVLATNGNGIVVTNAKGHQIYSITEANGLCSNNVNHIAYDGIGTLWGATDNGLFAIALPTIYSHFTSNEGLPGEVLAIQKGTEGQLYVGTLNGLYRRDGMAFVPVHGITHACWALQPMSGSLLAATSGGVYRVNSNGSVTQLTSASTTALLVKGDNFYTGEFDGVYKNALSGNRERICDGEKVTKIYEDRKGCLWFQNLYGQIWKTEAGVKTPRLLGKEDGKSDDAATLVDIDGQAVVVGATDTKPFPYPQFSYTDADGLTWLTDNEGKNLYVWKDNKRISDYDPLLYRLADKATRAILTDNQYLWVGGDFGLTIIDKQKKDPMQLKTPVLQFCSITVNGDSVLWGGFGQQPSSLPRLSRDERNLRFTFALDHTPLLGHTDYRYRVNGGVWSAWSSSTEARFFNHPSGSFLLEVQARDNMGRLSDIIGVDFSISLPFFVRWYMLLLYLILLALTVLGIIRWRLHRLEKEKVRLENIVQERTAEVVKQKDEIEEKSKSLETALKDLGEAQNELIRQEKMATVGKLTQGLIDRILNPMNYINNFSKLSEGLLKDVETNIDDDKDKMDAENYEDTKDVLNMLRTNLQKVGEHGQNTTRTLKAMEEMLKDRSGGIVPMDLAAVLRQDHEMLGKYYEKDIAQYGIKTRLELPEGELRINGNADQLSKTFMSLLGNSIYAVSKKAQRLQYQPEVSIIVSNIKPQTSNLITITIRDNGIGIEGTIIDKIFDPFFTTKTTGEAAGVGLYLSREIVQNHGGDISVNSVKNEYSEFIITLPAITL